MFTGIIQQLGTVVSREDLDGDARLVLEVPAALLPRTALGASLAVNGVCLTVAGQDDGRVVFDVSAETLSCTTLGRLAAGDPVNLEPALSASDPLGGHFVTGHVDGLGEILRLETDGRSQRMQVAAPPQLARYIAAKGCITLDGVSLTVNAVHGERFEVNIVPHTLAVTTLGKVRAGSVVNLEVDLVARYLERLAGAPDTTRQETDITAGFLAERGFQPPQLDPQADPAGEERGTESGK